MDRHGQGGRSGESVPPFAPFPTARYVTDLERGPEERRAGLKRLELARTGPVQHVATALVLAAGTDTAEQLAALAAEPDPELRKRVELAAEDCVVADLIAEGFPAEWARRCRTGTFVEPRFDEPPLNDHPDHLVA